MFLGRRARPLGERVEWIRVYTTWDQYFGSFSPKHGAPSCDDILHAQRVEGSMLPLEHYDGLIGERVDAQP